MRERVISRAKKVLELESQGILDLIPRLGDAFLLAVDLIFKCEGKVITTGIGKSGYIARKLASTLSSTGTPSVFLHPAESSHGDLGVISEGDVVIGISYSGDASEMNQIISYVARKKIPLIGITSNSQSSLGRSAAAVLDIKVGQEACPLKLAPTTSSTASLAMADALAMCVLDLRGFQAQDFAEFHPGGSLGARLLVRVKDVMHQGDAIPLVDLNTSIKTVLGVMTHKDVRGAAGVLNEKQELAGIITDGDVRRRLEKDLGLEGTAKDLMNLHPRTIDAEELAEKALFMMEQFKIQMLFVLDKTSPTPLKPLGILHVQDLLQAKIR